MANNKKRVYVVTLHEGGKKLYFERQHARIVQEGGLVANEPIGVFTPDLIDAKKFLDRSQAEWCASYFEGAGVECIKEGERLK